MNTTSSEARLQPIYLDHAATSPLRPEARAAMAPYLDARFGNPASVHGWGRDARAALEEARERLAGLLGGGRREIVFTSGGTEADNLAVLGRSRAAGSRGAVVACSAIEHSAVLGAQEQAVREGAEAAILAVDEDGRVLLGALEEALRARPTVVSVMWANNEVGVVQPVAEVGALCQAAGVAFHTDAVQAFGRVRVRVDEAGCDLLALSAHKLGGPRGVGLLYVRDGTALAPLLHGGGQERELRPGTVNVAGAAAFAAAAEAAVADLEAESARQRALRDRLEAALREAIPELVVNAAGAERLPHVLSVTVPGVDHGALLMSLDLEGIAVSSGSACHSGAVEPSHVLVAMGRTGESAQMIRFSLGCTNTEADIERAANVFPAVVGRVRAFAGA